MAIRLATSHEETIPGSLPGWLYVVSGSGVARINGKDHRIGPGTVLLIERGDEHEIHNKSRWFLKTINVYVPPAYRSDGTHRGAGRPR
jgi:mannose-6-phosphate isomerase-like protein (cupin superfamily)